MVASEKLGRQPKRVRGGAGKVIVESFIEFEYEITLLTLRHSGGTSFALPIGHRQVGGDYANL